MGIEFNNNKNPLRLSKVGQQPEQDKKNVVAKPKTTISNAETADTTPVNPDDVMTHLAQAATINMPKINGTTKPDAQNVEPDKMLPPTDEPETPVRGEDETPELPEDTVAKSNPELIENAPKIPNPKDILATRNAHNVEYNEQGLPTRIESVDENGYKFVIIYNYDENGEVTSSRYELYNSAANPEIPGTIYEYDANGELILVKKLPVGSVSKYTTYHYYVYDINGTEIGRETYYSDDNSLYSKDDYTRDENGKLISVTRTYYNADGSVERSAKEDYTRDENGNVISRTSTGYNADGSVSGSSKSDYTRDENGNLISETFTTYNADGSVNISCDYTYDENGNVISRTSTGYNADGSVKDYDKSDYTYDENGNVISKTYTDYNANGEVESVTKEDDTGKIKVEYTYDENGNIATTKEYIYDSEGDFVGSYWKSYDDNGNLTKSAEYDQNGNKVAVNQYHYDPNGNVITKTVMKYDANGNLVSIDTVSANKITEDLKLKKPENITIKPENPSKKPIIIPLPWNPNGVGEVSPFLGRDLGFTVDTDKLKIRIRQDLQVAASINHPFKKEL